MTKLLPAIFLFTAILFYSDKISAQLGEWTYMSGSTIANSTGSFGTQGVSSPSNHPPGFYEAAHWTDDQGNLWIFGGVTLVGANEWSDLWKYDPLINEWTWIKGSGIQSQPGIYGTQGISSPTNNPGSRAWGLLSWKDLNGDFWLYGGFGQDAFGLIGELGDLWKYSIATNEWTWMDGSMTSAASPVYGSYQTFSSSVYPGDIDETTASWIDTAGNLWFFGGGSTNFGNVNTLWEYDVNINQWAWMHGSNSGGASASYGTQGVFSASNHPDARDAYCTWTDINNKFWMFGGTGSGNYADLWEFDPDIKQWAWMSGSNVADYPGSIGTQCDTSANYTPCARRENTMCWVDSCGNVWMFGGYRDYTGGEFLSDMWAFSAASLSWAWVDGSLSGNNYPNYGVQGVSSPTNDPGGRMGCPFWKDLDGNLWLYGGWGNNSGIYADLWRYKPDPSCPGFVSCNASLVAGFEASSPELCEKFCVDFIDQTSGNPTSWQWSFPGGAPSSSTNQNPTGICYSLPGIYDVTLITTSGGGSDTLTLQNYITVYPTPPFPTITQNGYTLTSSPATNYQWQFNSVDIPGATNQSYDVQQSGLYTILITDQNSCSSSTTTYILIEGIEEVNAEGNVLVYPNPSNGSFIVQLLNCSIADNISVDVFNLLGQIIFSSEESRSIGTSVDCRMGIDLCKDGTCPVSTGVFFIEIKTNDYFVRRKIVIEN